MSCGKPKKQVHIVFKWVKQICIKMNANTELGKDKHTRIPRSRIRMLSMFKTVEIR